MNPADRTGDTATSRPLTYADLAAIAPALTYDDLEQVAPSLSWSGLRRATRADVVGWLVAARAIVARRPTRGRAIGIPAPASSLEGEIHAPRGPPTPPNRSDSLHPVEADPVAFQVVCATDVDPGVSPPPVDPSPRVLSPRRYTKPIASLDETRPALLPACPFDMPERGPPIAAPVSGSSDMSGAPDIPGAPGVPDSVRDLPPPRGFETDREK